MTPTDTTSSRWRPIATAPCDDRYAWVRWKNGEESIDDLDHDSDPQWWAERGATHWREATEEEKEIHWGRMTRRQEDDGAL